MIKKEKNWSKTTKTMEKSGWLANGPAGIKLVIKTESKTAERQKIYMKNIPSKKAPILIIYKLIKHKYSLVWEWF